MNPTTPHTPTPWYQLSGHVISRTVTAAHVSEQNLIVPGGILTAANARHIVHCVNTHAALVAALRLLRTEIYAADVDRVVLQQVDEALALAEGKE